MNPTRNVRGLVVAAAVLAVGSALAQPAPPVPPTPSELGDKRPRFDTDTSRLPQPERVPPRQLGKSDDESRIDVTGYAVSPNAPAALRQALAAITAPYVGPGKTLADLSDAAREVTRYLQRDLGHYLGLAYVPEQAPEGGVVQLEVLEGRLDQVLLDWKPGLPVDKAVVEGYLSRLKPGEVLLVQDVERVVFLLNDLRGINADFEVRPGRSVGTAQLVVTVRPTPLLDLSAELDNANSRYLGRARLGLTAVRYSPLGVGDSATASLTASSGLSFGLLNYTRPVGTDGLRLGLSVSALQYKVDKKAFPQGLTGTASTVSALALYPYVRSRNLNLFLLGTLDAKSYRDFDGATTNPKRLLNGGLGITGDLRDSEVGGGISSLDLLLTTGQVHFDTPPATDRPDANFSKLTLRAVRLQNLMAGQLQAYGVLKLQKAFNNLDVTEQFRAGGPDGVRAFPQGDGSGDNGALLTLELRALAPPDWLTAVGGRAFVALFADGAWVQQRNKPIAQDATFVNRWHYGGWGVSGVWNGPDGWDLRASLARPGGVSGRKNVEMTSGRLFVDISKRF